MSTSAPEPRANEVAFLEQELVVSLEDGRVVHVPLEWFPRLRDATEAQRKEWRLVGGGIGIHWPQVDEDLSVRGLLMPELMTPSRRRPA